MAWTVVRAVEELIKLHASETWARTFAKELRQCEQQKDFKEGNVGGIAQYLCKFATGGVVLAVVATIDCLRLNTPRSVFCACVLSLTAVFGLAGTSAKEHAGAIELCSILNMAIREDDPNVAVHAALFSYAINLQLVSSLEPKAWVTKVFKKSIP